MKPLAMMPAHLLPVRDVRRMYGEHTGNPTVARNTVNEWLKRRGVRAFGPSSRHRLFDRAAVLTALAADFPQEPHFISVEDAFLMAGLPYPNTRKQDTV